MICVRGWTGAQMRALAQGLRDGATTAELAAATGEGAKRVYYAIGVLRRFYPDLPAPRLGSQSRWTEAEEDALRRVLASRPEVSLETLLPALCAAVPHRPAFGVRSKAQALARSTLGRRKQPPRWTAFEEALLRRAWAPGVTLPGRSADACRQHGERVLGLELERKEAA